MRQKIRRPLQPGRIRPHRTPPAERTADWVIENELGWGLPHAAIGLLAILIVAARVVGWELDRLDAWLERRGSLAAVADALPDVVRPRTGSCDEGVRPLTQPFTIRRSRGTGFAPVARTPGGRRSRTIDAWLCPHAPYERPPARLGLRPRARRPVPCDRCAPCSTSCPETVGTTG